MNMLGAPPLSYKLLHRPCTACESHIPKEIFVAHGQEPEFFHAFQFITAAPSRQTIDRLRQLVDPGSKGVTTPVVDEALVWTCLCLPLFDLAPGIEMSVNETRASLRSRW